MPTPPYSDIAAWPPTRCTPPLSPEFRSAFDPFRAVFRIVWQHAFGFEFDVWQEELLRAVLEVFPEGHPRTGQLRFRQVVISLARQNGKTEIAAALGLWALLREAGALVIGIASSREQATLVYERTMQAINRNPALRAKFARLTDTRGIATKAGGRYELKAAKSAALQGLPIRLGLVDELHLLKRALWTDLVNGTGGRPDCLVAGITTAGDSQSELLIDLYRLGGEAIEEGDAARFGFFVWEAPESRIPEDDETLGRYLAAASPAIACGRLDLETVISDVRGLPEPDVIRYRFNRFLDAAQAAFIPVGVWRGAQRTEGDGWPAGVRPVFTFDRTPDWSFASIVATAKDAEGVIHAELVASLRSPNLAQLVEIAAKLHARHTPASIAHDGYGLRDFGKELRRRGIATHVGTPADAINAAGTLYAKAAGGDLRITPAPLLDQQAARAIRKNIGDAFRISRTDSAVEIDAMNALALGVLVAEVTPDTPVVQVF